MGEAFFNQNFSVAEGTRFAAINVTYPLNNSCTCTNGTIVLSDLESMGLVTFFIPEAGTWTVTCSDGTKTSSKTVSITAEGQFEKIKLVHGELLYDAGDECEDVTGGWIAGTAGQLASLAHAQKNANSFKVWVDSMEGASDYAYRWSYIRTANKISVKDFSKIQMTITEQSHYSSWEANERVRLILTNSDNCERNSSVASARASTNGAEIVSLPIDSTLTGTYYIGILCDASTASRVSAICTRIELIGS